MAVFMQPIFTRTVGVGGAASVTFNNIPQGFTDLKVVISARMSTSGAAYVGFLPNNNAGSIYSYTYMGISPTAGTVYTGRSINTAYGFFAFTSSGANTANAFSSNEFYIQNYSSGFLKTCILDSASEDNAVAGAASLSPNSFIMNSTEPITSIVVKDTVLGTNLLENTTITLYGISERFDTAAPSAPTLGTITDQAGFFSVAFTPAANDQADSYYAYSPASPTSPVYGSGSPIVIPVEAQYNYNASIWVAAVNSLGTTQSTTTSAGNVTSNNYTSIATGTISTTTSFFDFTNIPQYYKHLQLRIRVRGAAANPIDYFLVQIQPWTSNSDYYTHAMEAVNDSTVRGSIYAPTNTFTVNLMSSGNQNANNFTALVVDFYDYTNTTKFKTAQLFGGFSADNTTSGQNNGNITISGSVLPQYAPVTNIRLAAYVNLTVGSTFSLYGVS